jgi:hypothetical protein
VNSQNSTLDGHACGSRASSIDEDPFSIARLLRSRIRHSKVVVQGQCHSCYTDSNSGCLLIGHALRDLESRAFFDNAVVTEASTIRSGGIGTVGHTSDAIARLIVFRDLGSKGDYCASEVAPDCGAFRRKEGKVDVLPEDL